MLRYSCLFLCSYVVLDKYREIYCRTCSRDTTDHIERLKVEVNEVTYLLKENIEKMLDRGDKLRELQERSGTLQMYFTIT